MIYSQPSAVKPAAYAKLLKAIRDEIAAGKKIIDRTLAVTNWKVGRHISDFILQGKARAGYGEHLYERLAKDLNVGAKTLERAVRFSREFPIPTAQSELGWTHYYELLGIPGSSTRQAFVRRSLRKNLTTRQLQEEVARYKLARRPQLSPNLSVQRGRLYTYTIADVEAEAVFVDCGFNTVRKVIPKGAGKLAVGDRVSCAAEKGMYTLTPVQEDAGALYTYKAEVRKLIDADTPRVKIDLGFDTFSYRKLRLRGIDAPEISTAAGRRAKRFVEKLLKPCPFIVVKTYKDQSDKYDRYLVDIFCLAGETDPQVVANEGKFLNQELLDAGLAVRYEG